MRLNLHCARKGRKINIKGFINRILLPKAAGFFYFFSGVSIFKMKTCVKKLSTALAVSNTFVLAYLLNHIFQGQLYEHKTLIAMIFRTSFWILVALYFRKSNLFNRIECNC